MGRIATEITQKTKRWGKQSVTNAVRLIMPLGGQFPERDSNQQNLQFDAHCN